AAAITCIPQLIGPIAIICGFLGCLTVIATNLLLNFGRRGAGVAAIFVLIAVCLNVVEVNDNHRIRALAEAGDGAPPSLRDAFEAWYASRPDKLPAEPDVPPEQRKQYPVFVVASQGGGIYAAYHSALVLARLEDVCPGFSQHVFAISSVSGGSLGAALFSALASNYASSQERVSCNAEFGGGPGDRHWSIEDLAPTNKLQRRVHEYLARDFLSPVLQFALFPDFFQRFWPLPI